VLHGYLLRIFGAFVDSVGDDFGDGDEFLFLELGEELGVGKRLRVFDAFEQFAVRVLWLISDESDQRVAVLFYPLVLEAIALSNAGRFGANNALGRHG
jgi:hypothetical protein